MRIAFISSIRISPASRKMNLVRAFNARLDHHPAQGGSDQIYLSESGNEHKERCMVEMTNFQALFRACSEEGRARRDRRAGSAGFFRATFAVTFARRGCFSFVSS